MCICINCLFIKKCKAYKFIEKMHNIGVPEQKSLWNPKQTVLKNEVLTLRPNTNFEDWDIKECSSFVEKGGSWFI